MDQTTYLTLDALGITLIFIGAYMSVSSLRSWRSKVLFVIGGIIGLIGAAIAPSLHDLILPQSIGGN